MKTKHGIIAIVTLVFSIAATTAFAQGNWQSNGENMGVQLYQRPANELGENAFRGVLETDIHISKILPVFTETNHRRHWVYRFGDEEVIATTGDPSSNRWERRVWSRIDMPFPTKDRDYVFHNHYNIDPANKTITARMRTVEDSRVPERDCCVRAESNTLYTLTALPNGGTRLEVAVEVDLKGRIPASIVKGAQEEWPAETLTSLANRARAANAAPDSRVANW